MRRRVSQPKELQFDYIKSGMFRVIHVDGVHGGIAPNGSGIHASFFNDRIPISKVEVHEVEPDGTIGRLKTITKRPGVVREVEVCAILSVRAAEALHAWLGNLIPKARLMSDRVEAKRKQMEGGASSATAKKR